jgi:Kef-type K+ transport system membrane component KefB
MLFFIVTIGLDISVGEFRRIGRKALSVGIVGTLVPLRIASLLGDDITAARRVS